ncbi:hypothetical protein F1188_11085 [Roseospira marina]|uniref:Portal protein n=1 Tax=Roseospira marina TaxID=140057 RepID=A0A5M6ICT8_9PROT|nr:portal protein [Roseospira marina]KAA5605438.1 hypothetical protein F1188_11085 [Roseospira marina]MBB4314567.1 hypothetical protein [Roseospira marina]MBB5088871.1 hypothetical protein [Roseospira marina]
MPRASSSQAPRPDGGFISPQAPRRAPTQDPAVVAANLERFRLAHAGHQKWAEKAAECVRFYEDEQWTPEQRAELEAQGRSVLVLNRIKPVIRTVQGFMRRNRYETVFKPGNDGSGTKEAAEALSMVSKQIDERNGSKWVDAQVFQDGVQTGRGFWDVRLDFERNALGEVRIRELDPFSTYIDPEASTYEPDGWNFATVTRWMSLREIEVLFGRALADDLQADEQSGMPSRGDYGVEPADEITPDRSFGLDEFLADPYDTTQPILGTTSDLGGGRLGGAFNPVEHVNRARRLLRVLETQHWELREVWRATDYTTGQRMTLPPSWDDAKISRLIAWNEVRGNQVGIERAVIRAVRWTVTCCDRVLFDDWSPYQTMTIVPFFPYFRRGKTQGLIESLIDPQVEFNKSRMNRLDIMTRTANGGWDIEKGQLDDEAMRTLEEQGSSPGVIIERKAGTPPLARIRPDMPSPAWKVFEQDAATDIKEISGINDSAMGHIDRVQSGRAIEARQRQALNAVEPDFDNLARSREIKARVILGMVQRYYTEERIIRVRGEMDREQTVTINQRDPAGNIINNIAVGAYDVVIDETPVSSSYMQAQFEEAMELREKGVPIPDDILIKSSSIAGKDAVIERIEEAQAAQQAAAQAQHFAATAQMGLPPGTPLPPITAGAPFAVTAPSPPMGNGQPGAPRPGQAAAPQGAPPMPGPSPAPGAPMAPPFPQRAHTQRPGPRRPMP